MKRTIFLAILTFGLLTVSALAQTTNDKVLAQGNPPLTQGMVDKSREVFEFAFGGTLTEKEKQSFQDYLIAHWESSNTETIKATQELVGFYDKAAGLTKEKLVEIQAQLRDPLVRDLRNSADRDPFAKMLVGAYDRIRGLNAKQGGDLQPAPQDARQAGAAGGSIPKEILGEWVKSNTSNMTITNPGTGAFAPPSGEKIILHFYHDGTYKGAYFVQSSMSVGCTMTVYMPSTGVYRVEGNKLHLTEKSSRTISKDTCVARFNYEKDNKPGVYAYPAQLARDEYGTKLVLTMSDGNHDFYFNTGQSLLGGK